MLKTYEKGEEVPLGPNMDPFRYLGTVDKLLVHQEIELMEIITGFEQENKYHVKNSAGQELYYAEEKSDTCQRNCCPGLRSFDMRIYDNSKNEVIHLYRPFECMACCFPCCLQIMEVSAPPGNLIGTIKQKWSLFSQSFTIENSSGDVMYRIKGPCCACSCCGSDVVFRITTADGERDVGTITKEWMGLMREAHTDADNFVVTFPMDMDINMKATMLGACFLIDFMFFEGASGGRRR